MITVLVQLNIGFVRKLMGGFSLHPLNIVIKWGLTDLEHILQSFPVSCVCFLRMNLNKYSLLTWSPAGRNPLRGKILVQM